MTIQKLLKEKQMSAYRLSKLSEVPYGTCRDIVSGKADIRKCSSETVYKIARTLNISMESILEPVLTKRPSFENFKSAICHRVKNMGDRGFMIDVVESDSIRKYYDRGWYPESLYLLAMLDYLSRENGLPLCEDYDDLRKHKINKVVYPAGILIMSEVSKSDEPLRRAEQECIPEFRRHNIIEADIRNVV